MEEQFLSKPKRICFDLMQNMMEGVHASIILHWDTTPSTLPQASLLLRMNYQITAAEFKGGLNVFFPDIYLR